MNQFKRTFLRNRFSRPLGATEKHGRKDQAKAFPSGEGGRFANRPDEALRRERGWSQAQLAEMLHCSRQAYRHYEQGQVRVPTRIFVRLADIYNTSVDYLTERTDNPTPYPTITQ